MAIGFSYLLGVLAGLAVSGAVALASSIKNGLTASFGETDS